MIVLPREGTRWFWRTAELFGLLTALFVVWVSLGIGGEWLSNAVDDVGELVAALVAAAACAVASHRFDNLRVGWLFMALSSLAWACGEAIWCYYDLVRGIPLPYPSLADVGFLAAVPLAVVGLLKLFPHPARRAPSRLGGLLGGMLLGSSAFIAILALTLLHNAEGSELLQHLVGLAYPLGDLLMASVVLSAVHRGTGSRTTMRLVLAGIVAFTVADTWFAVTTIGNIGFGYWLDSGWVLGYFLVALGALWVSTDAAPAATQTSGVTPWTSGATYGPRGAPAAAAVVGAGQLVIAQSPSSQHWLASANTDHLVNYATILLIVVDLSVVLYDLASIGKLLV